MYTKAMSDCHISSISVTQFNQTRNQFSIRVLNFLLPNKLYFLKTSFGLSALNPVSPGVQDGVFHSVSGWVKFYAQSVMFGNSCLHCSGIYRPWIRWGAHDADALYTQLLFLEICNPKPSAWPMGLPAALRLLTKTVRKKWNYYFCL